MKNWLKKLRKIIWVLHEMISLFGHIVWADHRIREIDEAIEELKVKQK